MKKLRILVMTAITLVMVSTGHTAATEEEEPTDSSKSEDMPGMMGGMHGKGMIHQGMMGHHMMHSGMSPVMVFVYPGMMPMMGHGMMRHGMMQREKMEQRQSKMKKHMEQMEQQLANIEKLLGELVELQKKE